MMDERDIEATLTRMALTDLWGLAGRLAHRLREIGIDTPLMLRDAGYSVDARTLRVVMQRMVLELRRFPCVSLEDHVPNRKSTIASWSSGVR